MTWKELIKNYPCSIERLNNWCQNRENINIDFVTSMDTENEITFVPKSIKFLYDFFDKFPLYVILDQFDDCNFFVKITSYEVYDETKAFCQDGHIEEVYESASNGMEVFIFESRKDAEIHAFEKAFEILEQRIVYTPADHY